MSRWSSLVGGGGGEWDTGDCLFLLSRTVLHQSCELDVVEVSCIVTVLLVEHLFDFLLGESFAHRRQKPLELLTWDHLLAVRVEALEGVEDDVFGVGSVELLTEEGEEGGEVDVSRRLLDHVFEVRLWWVFTHRREHTGQIFFGDESVTVLVDHVEGFFVLLDLRLREEGKNVGGGLLGLLLSGSLLFTHPDSRPVLRFASKRVKV